MVGENKPGNGSGDSDERYDNKKKSGSQVGSKGEKGVSTTYNGREYLDRGNF